MRRLALEGCRPRGAALHAIWRILAFRRFLYWAARFLRIKPLPTILSISGTAARKLSWASGLSPAATARSTLFIAVRILDRNAMLCRRRVVFCRARFFADWIFAKVDPDRGGGEKGGIIRSPRKQVKLGQA
jgi:hypothetical protein